MHRRRRRRRARREPPTDQELADQGGDATVEIAGNGAFAQPVPGLDSQQRRDFAVGNNFFNDNWVTAPSSTEGRDGLGPLFNAQSCSSCHFRDGRAQPPADADDPERGLLIRLSVLDEDGNPMPHRDLGDQLQDRAIRGRAGGGHAAHHARGGRRASTTTAPRTPSSSRTTR